MSYSSSTATRTRRIVIAAVIVATAMSLAAIAAIGLTAWRLFESESETMRAMRVFVDEAYPDYRVVDSTRSGYVLQHERLERIRIDVRFAGPGTIAVWSGPPKEALGQGWSTVETFFRHAQGEPADPRTGLNYDIEGFAEAYAPLRPGANAVISAVWLDHAEDGVEYYTVWVARRNRDGSRVEDMWPDHQATFKRDQKTGEWSGWLFEPVEVPSRD